MRTTRPSWNWTTLESRSRHANAVEGRTAGDQWASVVSENGNAPRQDITVSIVEPPAHVRERLELSADGLAVARKRVRFIDNRPYALADSYFPQELVSGTPLMEPRDVSAPEASSPPSGSCKPSTWTKSQCACRLAKRLSYLAYLRQRR
ncbi:UTRA domain-containing protein [Streptomyces sp. T1317-0309]|nr:UTRA domain-containing protein [Streptomyces sp. T1317-0309]